MPDTLADPLRSLLASDVYTEKGRLRSDDQLVRERVVRGMTEATASIRQLISRWRADVVPPSTREQPFPPAEVMEPIRKAERLIRMIDDAAALVKGLPVLNQDKVWDRVRRAGLEDLLQFDWTLVGESDVLARDLAQVPALNEIDVPPREARVRRIREIIGERQRYIEISRPGWRRTLARVPCRRPSERQHGTRVAVTGRAGAPRCARSARAARPGSG